MKSTLFCMFLIITSISFGQVIQNKVLNLENSIDEPLHFKNSEYSLNMDSFGIKVNTDIRKNLVFCESFVNLIKCEQSSLFYNLDADFLLRTIPTDNMKEKKQEIYDFLELKYYLQSVG